LQERFMPDIENSENCNCSVLSYEGDIQLLMIKVDNGKTKLFLGFHYVLYFSGFWDWDGAVFDIMPREMCIELLKEAGYGTERKPSAEELVENYYGSNVKLYRASMAKPGVEILAQHVIVYNEAMQTIDSHGI
jgi:hypothetical protein